MQLSEMTTVGPSPADIWEYFETKVAPIVCEWQVESTLRTDSKLSHPTSATNEIAINIWLTNLLDELESKELTLNEVMTYYKASIIS